MNLALDAFLKDILGGQNTKYYAGIGSRTTPADILRLMSDLAMVLGGKGYLLRSGGADGADHAFELGADRGEYSKNIWLPWPHFNNRKYKGYLPAEKHFTVASKIHPAWDYFKKDSLKKLHARNMGQVLGSGWVLEEILPYLAPGYDGEIVLPDCASKFVLCWTPDGVEHHSKVTTKTGGTGTAIRLASKLGIPVINLKNDNALSRLEMIA